VLAVWQVASEAIERARAGDGPTLIEALTYRIQGHSSSDDPSIYRDAGEPEVWERRDPVNRLRNYLQHRGLWSERWEAELAERHDHEITAALTAAEHKRPPPVDSLFDDVYDEPPWHLREQRAYLAAQPRTPNPHHR
jgi:2-oxoisovalerate dehydrogenase E1 component alpha subunit